MNFSDERAIGYLSVYRCIHCNRHFAGERAEQAVKDHMRQEHGKRANFGDDGLNNEGIPSGNVRFMPVPVTNSMGWLTLSRFDGTIEVYNEEK